MLLRVKLYGGLVCGNKSIECCGSRKFQLEMPKGVALNDVHGYLGLNPSENLVTIVNGHAQPPGYVLSEDSSISIFPPMADRQYNFFEGI